MREGNATLANPFLSKVCSLASFGLEKSGTRVLSWSLQMIMQKAKRNPMDVDGKDGGGATDKS